MSAVCLERLVGHVMACSINSNGLNATDTEQKGIIERIQAEIKKVEKFAEELAARKKDQQASGGLSPEIIMEADDTAMPADPAEKQRLTDRTVICSVMCCCNANPAKGEKGGDLWQSCAKEVFKEADRALGWKSRYKAEISWNMNAHTGELPVPLMHRDAQGQNTTEPSHHWQKRVSEVDRYLPKQGHIRRPDLVIVSDSTKPPSQDTIERVVEFKFKLDRRDREQDRAYRRIAGNVENYSVYRVGAPLQDEDEQACNCQNPMQMPN